MPAQTAVRSDDKFAYDEVPYLSFPYSHTHPDHLATIASLFGMKPPALETARVLELGSASGGNIFPLALRYPKATFLGLDLSREQIAVADAQKEALGLKNISFRQQDILAFDLKKNRGAFDYIICHGVYSWVPEEVSARILDICRDCLSENGLAMVSYNTLPGWNSVRSLREMMRFHSERAGGPAQKTAEARKLLNFLSETAAEGSPYKGIISEELKMLSQMNDSYLYHDHLEGINRQFYLHQFVDDLQKHGLAYVGDSSLTSMFVENLSPKAIAALKVVNDFVLQEQYVDFVVNRRFRCSIISRKGATLQRSLRDAQIMDYCLTANMRLENPSPDFSKPVKFLSSSGQGSFTTGNEIASVVYDEIVKSGIRPIAATEVVTRAQKRLKGIAPDAVRAGLVENGLRLALRGFLTLHMNSPAFTGTVSKKPAAAPLARQQASQPGCGSVTNLLGNSIRIAGIAAMIIPLLDGTRTLDDVVAVLATRVKEGKITLTGNTSAANVAAFTAGLGQNIASVAAQLAAQALLTA